MGIISPTLHHYPRNLVSHFLKIMLSSLFNLTQEILIDMHSLYYILHFLRDLIIIFFVTSGVRILDKAIEWLNYIFPAPAKSPLPHNYLGFDTVVIIVTVLDAVAIVTISIIGISTVMKFWQEHRWWQPHHEVPCDHPDCPQKNSHTTKEG